MRNTASYWFVISGLRLYHILGKRRIWPRPSTFANTTFVDVSAGIEECIEVRVHTSSVSDERVGSSKSKMPDLGGYAHVRGGTSNRRTSQLVIPIAEWLVGLDSRFRCALRSLSRHPAQYYHPLAMGCISERCQPFRSLYRRPIERWWFDYIGDG